MADKISGIYKIQSKSTPELLYIGASVDIYSRWKSHLQNLKDKKHHSTKLQVHYDKYGLDDLEFTILSVCDKTLLRDTEQYFFDTFNPYFNSCRVYYGSPPNVSHKTTQSYLDHSKKPISVFVLLSSDPPKVYKSLRSLSQNNPNLKYFSIYRAFIGKQAIYVGDISIYRAKVI